MDAKTIRLRGEGGGVWEYELPLDAAHAEQVKARKLQPADDDAAKALAAQPELTQTAASTGGGEENEKPLEKLSGAECDEKAAKLGVNPWDSKGKVAAKRSVLAAWIAEHPAGDGGDGGGDDDDSVEQ